jgi:hypothetical protein
LKQQSDLKPFFIHSANKSVLAATAAIFDAFFPCDFDAIFDAFFPCDFDAIFDAFFPCDF